VDPPRGCNHAAPTSTHDRRGGTGHFYTKDRTALTPYGLAITGQADAEGAQSWLRKRRRARRLIPRTRPRAAAEDRSGRASRHLAAGAGVVRRSERCLCDGRACRPRRVSDAPERSFVDLSRALAVGITPMRKASRRAQYARLRRVPRGGWAAWLLIRHPETAGVVSGCQREVTASRAPEDLRSVARPR
jgi:hypothetical protein